MAEEQSQVAGRARVNYEQSLSEFAKWNILRIIGGSAIGKVAIFVPFLGYLLLFNQEVVDFLNMHSALCKECNIPWRLHFIYFGSFFVGIGSVVYALVCPTMVERHAGAPEFYEAEKDYYDAPEHREFLVGHILKARATTYIRPEFMYPKHPEQVMLTSTSLQQLMGEHYFLQNRSWRKTRLTILGSYALGGLLLAVPTLWTFFQVLYRLL